MILCSCTCLTDADLQAACARLSQADPWAVLTPGQVFHQCGRRVQCGFCARLVADRIAQRQSRIQAELSKISDQERTRHERQ